MKGKERLAMGSLFSGSGGFELADLLTGKIRPLWAGKRKTDAAIRQWSQGPHSDSAEYRLWGNALALPCATYVMCGIADKAKEGK